jgi:hypothetical protein
MQPEPVGPARSPAFWPGTSTARPGGQRTWAGPARGTRSCLGRPPARGSARPDTAKIRGPVAREADVDPKGQSSPTHRPSLRPTPPAYINRHQTMLPNPKPNPLHHARSRSRSQLSPSRARAAVARRPSLAPWTIVFDSDDLDPHLTAPHLALSPPVLPSLFPLL